MIRGEQSADEESVADIISGVLPREFRALGSAIRLSGGMGATAVAGVPTAQAVFPARIQTGKEQ